MLVVPIRTWAHTIRGRIHVENSWSLADGAGLNLRVGENSMRQDTLLDWIDGVAHFRGLPVECRTVSCAGHTFEMTVLKDEADLLDLPEIAKRFLHEDRAPYGVELWPAALMLAEHILQNESGKGRRAIEIGCGLALVSMVATLKGWRVDATDCDPTSLRFAEYNAAVNKISVEAFEVLDWHNPPGGEQFDRVFGADVLYELKDHIPVIKCVDRLLKPAGIALLVDPNRGLADRFAPVAQDHGFDVQTTSTCAVNAEGRQVSGRVFHLAVQRGLDSAVLGVLWRFAESGGSSTSAVDDCVTDRPCGLVLQLAWRSASRLIPVDVGKDINGAEVAQEPCPVLDTGRYEVRIAGRISLGLASDGQLHFALDNDTPLVTVGVHGHLADRVDIEKDNLVILGLRQPTPYAWKREVNLRETSDHFRVRSVAHARTSCRKGRWGFRHTVLPRP